MRASARDDYRVEVGYVHIGFDYTVPCTDSPRYTGVFADYFEDGGAAIFDTMRTRRRLEMTFLERLDPVVRNPSLRLDGIWVLHV
jgi:hypothetical protein